MAVRNPLSPQRPWIPPHPHWSHFLEGGRLPAQERSGPSSFSEPAPVQSGERAHPGFALDLELVGVVMAGVASMAIIADAGGRQKVYRIGNPIRSGAMLDEVLRDGAILAVGDARQWLPLTRVAAAIPTLEDGQSTSRRTESAASAKGPTHGVGRAPSRRLLNPKVEMLTQGLFAPNPNGGFQVENVKLGSVYARMGLRVGDVLRGVNGRPVDSTERLMVLHQQLNEGGH